MGQLTGEADGKARDWVFCSYDPQWGGFKATSFVHNRTYKLYDSGLMYNMEKDPLEEQPLKKGEMTGEEGKIFEYFEQILGENRSGGKK